MSSIIEELVAVVEIPYFPNLRGAERSPLYLHLHWVLNPSPANPRQAFQISSAKASTAADLLDFVRSIEGMSEEIVTSYAETFASYDSHDETSNKALSPEERARVPATYRLANTVETSEGRFVGFKLLSVQSPSKTLSGSDPRNLDLPFFEPLQAILGAEKVELSRPDSWRLVLERVVKEFSKNEEWETRAHSAIRDLEQAADDGDVIRTLKTRAIQVLNFDEKVILGGRRSSPLLYALSAPGACV